MKNQIQFPLVVFLLFSVSISNAQLSTNANGFYIAANTNVIIDSLVIVPTVATSFTNTNILRTSTPIVAPGGNSILRVHTFSAPISVTGTVGLYFLNSELNGNTAANLKFVWLNSADNTYTTSSNSSLDLVQKFVSQVMSSTPMLKVSATNTGVSLPIILSSYNASAEGSRAKIEWTIASELNADHYELQRSADGINFTTIATVRSDNFDVSHTYYSYDNAPLDGQNFYRLIQYDIDGSKKVFGIKEVQFKNTDLLTVMAYPNPVINTLSVKLQNYTGDKVDLSLFDFHGKLVHKESILTNSSQTIYPIHLQTKPLSGDYILKITGLKGLNESVKVTVL